MSRVLFDIFDFINYLFKTLCKEVMQCLVMILMITRFSMLIINLSEY